MMKTWLFSYYVLYPFFYKHYRETLLYGRDTSCSEDVRKVLTQKDLIDSQLQKLSIESNDSLLVKESSRNKRSMICNYCRKKGILREIVGS